MTKLRVSRKAKKWHRKNGWCGPHFVKGRAYWAREYRLPGRYPLFVEVPRGK